MSVEFDTPANRVIAQQQPKNQFRIDTSLPDLAFLRQLSIQGRLRTFSGSRTAAAGADFLSIVPANGQTLFIYSFYITHTGADLEFNVAYDGNIRLSVRLTGLTTGVYDAPYFDSFVGDGIKTLTIGYTTSTSGTKQAILLGWVENTARIRDVSN